ncbi:MAG: cellulose biosynthesis cyclic di-GMP-binding regulatory protein BcsB, partial [Litorimonas sp.]
GNVLRLSYAVRCDAPSGGYRVDLRESRLDVAALPRDTGLSLRDVGALFDSPLFAPRLVGLVASGPEQTKLQALAAQAVGLRMADVPDFRLSAGEADFDILMVRREHLADYTDDPNLLQTLGAQIAVSETHPGRLYLTGDTDAQVMEAVSAFAARTLPATHRRAISPEEAAQTSPLDADRHLVRNRARLDMLSVQTGLHRSFKFDVADPAASEGELLLRLTRDGQTQSGSQLAATLNGQTLGQARVRGRRKTVAYPIPPGLLKGADNRLELTTIDGNPSPRCDASPPFIAIAEGSELRLDTPAPTPTTDLSRFAADGTDFGRDAGAKTVLVLPETNFDFTTSLGVVAQLARSTGQGWTQAGFVRGDTDDRVRHVLRIEPVTEIERHVRLTAPRGLLSAWRGQTIESGPSGLAGQFASLDGEQAMLQAARTLSRTKIARATGVAAVYPLRDGRLVGIVSNTPQSSFAEALDPLRSADLWNALSGAVTQWNDDSVYMAQTALPLPEALGLASGEPEPQSLTQIAKARAAALRDIDWPEPRIADVGDWVDARWTGFSATVRSQADAARLDAVVETATLGLSEAPDAARRALDEAKASRAGKTTKRGLTDLSTRAGELRTELWRHVKIRNPEMKAAGFGQAQTLPLALGVCVLVLMFMIGMAFAGPTARDAADEG